MSAVINSNYGATVARKNLAENQHSINRSFERLSIGKKTINASDDAAGIAIAGKMEAQIRGLDMSIRHAKDGQSLAGAAEGAMNEVNQMLQRMRELAVQASSGVASNIDKDYLNVEMANLVSQIEALSINMKFNGKTLLRGNEFTFMTDIDVSGTKITTVAADMATTTLGIPIGAVSIGGGVAQNTLDNVVSILDVAIGSVNSKRASLGAISNRFDHIINNLQNVIMNTLKSKSVMIDADFSAETTNLTKANVLQQGSTSMLAQANAQKNTILALLN